MSIADSVWKLCPRCHENKPLDAFYRNRGQKHGRSSYCKPCHNASKNDPAVQRRWYLKHTYGLTLEGYQALLDAQGGVCAVCGGVPDKGKSFAVDHDHACCPTAKTCGECVRGLLCGRCNRALGNFERRADLFAAASRYLERSRRPPRRPGQCPLGCGEGYINLFCPVHGTG